MSKSFSLEQVNQILPEVELRLKAIQDKRAVYLRVHDAIFVQELANNAEKKNTADFFDSDLDADIQNLEETIYDLSKEVDSLIELGCVLRSMDLGLIDFPGQHHGERVFFSWKAGEKQIAFIRRRSSSGASAERFPI